MLFTKGDRLYVPKWGDLRQAILKECHDSKWADHPGITRTLALIEGTYYWPRMGDDVETFVRAVSMDFITCLPKSEGGGSIIVVVDRFSKYETFIAAPPDVTADDTAKLFFKNMIKYWEMPHVIVSDRDPRFTGHFWTELFKIMGTDLNFSTSFHPQTDGEATGKSPFELVTGHQPLTPNALAASYKGSSPAAYKTMKEWHEKANLARASLDKAAKKMKKWADERRRHVKFEVEDQVMVQLLPQQCKSLRKVHKGLIRRYEGPFLVIGRVGKVEEILSDCTIRRRGVPSYKEYLIKWRDLPDSEASWEAEDLLWQFADEIKRYHEDDTTRTREKVLEALGSPWKLMKDLEASCRSLSNLRNFLGDTQTYKILQKAPFVHVDDVASAHIHLFECPNTKGRYICSKGEILIEELYKLLSVKYPEYKIPDIEFLKSEDVEKMMYPSISSEKLLGTGFQFKYGLEEMFDDAIECLPTRRDDKYFITFIDDSTKYWYVYLLKSKDEAIDKFILYKNEVENQLNKKIKVIRSNRGGEYVSSFAEFCSQHGIRHELTALYSPQQNGIAERKNHTLKEMANAMLRSSGSNKNM
ncbi:putative nucleotidyltransferase, ribonuclease H [Tanacetum coccineum]